MSSYLMVYQLRQIACHISNFTLKGNWKIHKKKTHNTVNGKKWKDFSDCEKLLRQMLVANGPMSRITYQSRGYSSAPSISVDPHQRKSHDPIVRPTVVHFYRGHCPEQLLNYFGGVAHSKKTFLNPKTSLRLLNVDRSVTVEAGSWL